MTLDDTTDIAGSTVASGAVAPGVVGPAWDRLEEQLAWHDRKASSNQRYYRTLKVSELGAAAAIPVVAAAGAAGWLTGGLGALVVVMEGINQLFRFHDTWINYRLTCEGLRREKYLYLSAARPYDKHSRPQALLAQRVEAILSREQVQWTTTMSQEGRTEHE